MLFAYFLVRIIYKNIHYQLKTVEYAKPAISDAVFDPHYVYLASAVARRSDLVSNDLRDTHPPSLGKFFSSNVLVTCRGSRSIPMLTMFERYRSSLFGRFSIHRYLKESDE